MMTYEEIKELLSRIKYPNTEFKVDQNLNVSVILTTKDVRGLIEGDLTIYLQTGIPKPSKGWRKPLLLSVIHACVLVLQIHEAEENFQCDGKPVFDPHRGRGLYRSVPLTKWSKISLDRASKIVGLLMSDNVL